MTTWKEFLEYKLQENFSDYSSVKSMIVPWIMYKPGITLDEIMSAISGYYRKKGGIVDQVPHILEELERAHLIENHNNRYFIPRDLMPMLEKDYTFGSEHYLDNLSHFLSKASTLK